MKSVMKKLMVTAVMLAAMSAGIWANGSAENGNASYTFTHSTVNETAYLPLQVAATGEIRDFFEAKGVDPAYLDKDLSEIPPAVRNNIDSIVKEDSDGDGTSDNVLSPMIRSELRSNIRPGSAEYVYMMTGRYKWTLAMNVYNDDGALVF